MVTSQNNKLTFMYSSSPQDLKRKGKELIVIVFFFGETTPKK